MIKCIIFDFGSVLFKTNWLEIGKEFEEKYGFDIRIENRPELLDTWRLLDVGKLTMHEFLLKLHPTINVKEAYKFYKQCYLKNQTHNKELLSLIKRLRKHYTLYGFTGTNHAHFEANKESGLTDYFDNVFTSFHFGKNKSDESAFSDLLDKIPFKASECLFIDDLEINIENADKAGFHTILYKEFPSIESLKKEMKEKGINIES